jgi:Tfp pilus assembly protein PilO
MHAKNPQGVGATAVAALVFSLAMLCALATTRFIAKPQWESFFRNTSRLTEIKKNLHNKNGLDSIAQFLALQQDSLASKFATLKQFEETKDLPGALRMIIEKANAAGIQFVKMQPRSEGGAGKAGAYPVILEMNASYNSLGHFISLLEAAPQMLRIERLAVTVGNKATLDIKLQLTCFLNKNG